MKDVEFACEKENFLKTFYAFQQKYFAVSFDIKSIFKILTFPKEKSCSKMLTFKPKIAKSQPRTVITR